jgi:CheY-like chemotaxis protein
MKCQQHITSLPTIAITLFMVLFGVVPPSHAIDRVSVDNLQAAIHTLSFLESLPKGGTILVGVVYPSDIATTEVLATETAKVIGTMHGPNSRTLQPIVLSTNALAKFEGRPDLVFLVMGASKAVNGLEAVTSAEVVRPDLILMDIRMPVMGGLEAMHRMQQNPDLVMVPVVAVSAGVTQDEQVGCMAAGAKAFLTKPIENQCLLQEIGRLLNLTWIRENPQQTTSPVGDRVDPFVIPEPAQMESLRELAKAGNMRAIREQADQLATLNEQYRPFADKITQLARGYQTKALLRLVEKHAAQEQLQLVENHE